MRANDGGGVQGCRSGRGLVRGLIRRGSEGVVEEEDGNERGMRVWGLALSIHTAWVLWMGGIAKSRLSLH